MQLETAEQEYRRRWPHKYASTARIIDTCMQLSRRKCVGGECGEFGFCRRHDRSEQVAERLERLRARRRS